MVGYGIAAVGATVFFVATATYNLERLWWLLVVNLGV